MGAQPPMPPPMPAPSGGLNKLKVIGIAALVAVGTIGGGILFYYLHTHPDLYIVNATGKDGVSVFLDGEPIAQGLKNAATESRSLVSKQTVSSGTHKIESKDATGKVLESFNFEFDTGVGTTYVYAPARDPKICFIVQTDEYKTNAAAPDTVKDHFKPLDQSKTIWMVPESIDYWFQDSPDNITIKTKKGQSSSNVIKRSLRQAPCNDPNFQD
jgi:hypothetical protein